LNANGPQINGICCALDCFLVFTCGKSGYLVYCCQMSKVDLRGSFDK